ncbi:MAG: ABC transporter ATP-binding protein [Anaerolineaceae bacterium]|nr:ABC transporter ATP-binding protein [Anaerolineaceae bacterium]
MAEIRIENLVKIFPGGTRAVDGVSIHVSDGEFLVMLGPSGCGKTTTLRSVAGLERQTSGDIFIGERLVNNVAPADRDIAFVFQFYALYPHLKVYDNVAFPLRAAGVAEAEIRERVLAVAQMLKIDQLLNRRPSRLPAGEQQRVALGRAIIRRPQVFLLDEPLTNLDPAMRVVMRAELKRLHQEIATTTLYVTHDQTEAMSLGQRVAVMRLGKLEQLDTPLNIYDHPATLFVAGFIGSPPMNFVGVRLAEGPALVNSTRGFCLPIDASLADKLPSDAALVLGVRSEDMQISSDPSWGELQAEVEVFEPLGDENIYSLRFAGGHKLLVKAPPTLELALGTLVGVHLDQNRLHVFEEASGKALR